MSGIVIQAYYPEKKSIGELLALTNPAIIVPDWQRNYSWRSEHIDTFWNDIEKFSERSGENPTDEYFFGSLVLVRSADQRLLLLDGQQRLATSTILLSSVRDVIKGLKEKTADWIQDNYLSSHDPIKNAVIHKIRLNVYDRDFFQRLVTEPRNEGYVEPEPQHASHNLIIWAKRYFTKVLGESIAALEPDAAIKWLGRIVDILTNHFTVIAAFSDKRATGELDVNPPSKVHVEHIYPQTPEEGQKWATHDRFINRIGNLTLLDKRINAAIKNSGFLVKKGHYEGSEIVLTNELCDLDDWSEERVAVRQHGLAGLVPGIWPLIHP